MPGALSYFDGLANTLAMANSYFGLIRQAGASHADQARLARSVLKRGHCVNKAFTQTYPTSR